jgi:3-oxoacyl-[acyl-carrier protein] reductase
MPKSEKPVAIITGGSRGVGEATAKLLASKGWNVTITCTSTIEDANGVVDDCKKLGVEGLVIKADVSDDQACRETIEETVAKWGRIDCLVNNAGTTKFVFEPRT